MRTGNAELWQQRIDARKESGLTIVDWCDQQQISLYTYYYWNRKLKQEKERDSDQLLFVEVDSSQKATEDAKKLTVEYRGAFIHILDKNSIPLAAEFLIQLQNLC